MSEIGLSPPLLIVVAAAMFVVLHMLARIAMPFVFVLMAVVMALLAGFGFPFRHLVEGGFGFINLIMALFAGAFFGQAVRGSGAANRLAGWLAERAGYRVPIVLVAAAVPLFVVGMFSGIAGVAVLAGGVFVVPALKRLGFRSDIIASFIAVVAVAGMIAPPVNVPAMLIADGVNMPFTNVAKSLLALSVPFLLVSLVWFGYLGRKGTPERGDGNGASMNLFAAVLPLLLIVVIWAGVRAFGSRVIDPATPLILVIGTLAALPFIRWPAHKSLVRDVFSGTPLLLAAILVSIGVFIQIFTMTGARGWLVVQVMSIGEPWSYLALSVGLPLLGGVLSSLGSSAMLAVPVAFSFLSQNMILNVSALSAVSALSEFVAPTAISAALACYVVGDGVRIRDVLRCSWPPLLFLLATSLAMLAFAVPLAGPLT